MHLEARKRPKSQRLAVFKFNNYSRQSVISILFSPTALQSFFRPWLNQAFTNNLKRNSAKHFTKPNKLTKQNEEVSIICKRSMHDNIRASKAVKGSKSMVFLLPKVNRRRNYSSLQSGCPY